jgi:hypothetical protein
MDNTTKKFIFWIGIFGLAGAILNLIEIPLWIIPGAAPQISDTIAHAQFISGERIIALSRILIDVLMYMCLMVLFAGFRYLICKTNKKYEWIATLNFVAASVWWAVSLVADGLEGGAVLDTLGNMNPVIVRTLVEGTLLIYNGSIAFAVTALFMGTAGFLILKTKALPKWIGWLSLTSMVLCFVAIPAMYGAAVDTNGFYNAAGWGPIIIANVPSLIWFFAVSIAMIKKSKNKN